MGNIENRISKNLFSGLNKDSPGEYRKTIQNMFSEDGMKLKDFSSFNWEKDMVLAAVKQNGEALRYASTELQGDKEVVLAAVAQDGDAFEYASKELQEDEEVKKAKKLWETRILCWLL